VQTDLNPGRIGTLLFLAVSAIKSSSLASFARGSDEDFVVISEARGKDKYKPRTL
jgi:hypothetical protein